VYPVGSQLNYTTNRIIHIITMNQSDSGDLCFFEWNSPIGQFDGVYACITHITKSNDSCSPIQEWHALYRIKFN
jgi:hypothetical protein